MASEYLTLHTGQLREGDIVHNQGMRILIDGPVETEHTNPDRPRYTWPGLVTNADELCDRDSEKYDSYIHYFLRGTGWEDRVPRTRKDSWPITGNDLATWSVERTI